MNILKKLILLLSYILFSGCSYPSTSYNYEFKTTDYNDIISTLLKKASKQIFPYIKKDEILLVSNFAETTTLKSNTQLSFLLSDLLKNQLVSKHHYTVREIELSKQFRLGSQGLRVLTRDANAINMKRDEKAKFVVVGTYTFTKHQLILFLKLVDIKYSKVLASSTYSTDLTQEIVDSNKIIINNQLAPAQINQPFVL